MHLRRFMGCKNLIFVKTSVSKPSALGLRFLKGSHPCFPLRAPEASTAIRESATWGSDVQLEAMESEQTGLAFSLPRTPENVRASSLVEFAHDSMPCSLRRGSPDSSKQRFEGFCATSGNFLPYTKGSNRGSTSVGPETRPFQPLLSCTKEGRRSTTHSGPLQREVQDVDVEDYYVPDSSGRLVCHCRPKGCLFSHSGRPVTQEVPSLCLWRKGLPVQGSSLWLGLGPEDIHKVHGCCSGPFEAPGHS